jgi:hypothetical protein
MYQGKSRTKIFCMTDLQSGKEISAPGSKTSAQMCTFGNPNSNGFAQT